MKIPWWGWLVLNVAVVYIAFRVMPRVVPEDHHALPDPVKAFFDRYNLSDTYDSDMIALRQGERPGQEAGAPKKKHPIVIVPGIISCGLEVWKSKPCLGNFFRRRVWTGTDMAIAATSNTSCWLEHVALNSTTGLDPDGIKVRAAKGIAAADYFVTGYWLWGKVVENLADIGYDEEDILMECYDWRLAYPLLEQRDGKFTQMRHNIESAVERSGEKVVMVAHSMGGMTAFYFLNWVERSHPGWVERHIASFVNVAGAMLGAMGPLAAYLSGEMEATATLGPLVDVIDRYVLSWERQREIYWSIGGLGSLLPVGGSAVWGSSASGFTDTPVDVVSYDFGTSQPPGPRTLEDIYEEMGKSPRGQTPSWTSYQRHARNPQGKLPEDPSHFHPLASPLPNAPSLKIFCVYGVGIPTERAYQYSPKSVRWRWGENETMLSQTPLSWSRSAKVKEVTAELQTYLSTEDRKRPVELESAGEYNRFATVDDAISFLTRVLQQNVEPEKWLRIDGSYTSPEDTDPWGNGVDGIYHSGVARTDGDGTVPLVSLGYMCTNGWRDFPELNPANVSVWTKEMRGKDTLTIVDPRGGPRTVKHVELIGNTEFIRDLLHIAAGNTSHLEQDTLMSNISDIGSRITERLRKTM